jgi:hypothetical protein
MVISELQGMQKLVLELGDDGGRELGEIGEEEEGAVEGVVRREPIVAAIDLRNDVASVREVAAARKLRNKVGKELQGDGIRRGEQIGQATEDIVFEVDGVEFSEEAEPNTGEDGALRVVGIQDVADLIGETFDRPVELVEVHDLPGVDDLPGVRPAAGDNIVEGIGDDEFF